MMGKCGWNGRKGWDKDMEQEKLYVIEEKTYEAHIDEEVHLYGLLHQLAFLAGLYKSGYAEFCGQSSPEVHRGQSRGKYP